MAIAARYGHESAFVCEPRDTGSTYRLRFFVPRHEMEMCGHATLGALWLLRRLGRWTSRVATLETLSGIVDARFDESTQSIEVSQPKGIVQSIEDARWKCVVGKAGRPTALLVCEQATAYELCTREASAQAGRESRTTTACLCTTGRTVTRMRGLCVHETRHGC